MGKLTYLDFEPFELNKIHLNKTYLAYWNILTLFFLITEKKLILNFNKLAWGGWIQIHIQLYKFISNLFVLTINLI